MSNKSIKIIEEAISYIENYSFSTPEIGIVLGTGLGGLLKKCKIKLRIPYKEIPNFPISSVESHHGYLIFWNY